jgi:hypothetical protein
MEIIIGFIVGFVIGIMMFGYKLKKREPDNNIDKK